MICDPAAKEFQDVKEEKEKGEEDENVRQNTGKKEQRKREIKYGE